MGRGSLTINASHPQYCAVKLAGNESATTPICQRLTRPYSNMGRLKLLIGSCCMRMIDENNSNLRSGESCRLLLLGRKAGTGAEQCNDVSTDVSPRWRIKVEGSMDTNVVNYFIFDAAGRGNSEAEQFRLYQSPVSLRPGD